LVAIKLQCREMLSIIACLVGVFAVLVSAEVLGKHKVLRGEYRRKFVHVIAGSFIAFWPWFMSWRSIQIIGLAMVIFMLVNRNLRALNFMGGVKRISYGDIFLALAVSVCAFLTKEKLFFNLAILQVALADGLAAAIGIKYGMHLKYKVFGHIKTVYGTMAVWFISLCIISVGGLFAYTQITFLGYAVLVLVLPPILTVVENFGVFGLDNIAMPLVVLGGLYLVQNL